MFDWAMLTLGVLIVGTALWMRAAIVSLNKDMRAILDAHATIRGRLGDIVDEHAAIQARINAVEALYRAHQGDEHG